MIFHIAYHRILYCLFFLPLGSSTSNANATNFNEIKTSSNNKINNLQLFLSYLMEKYSDVGNINDSDNYLTDTLHYNNEESVPATSNAIWMSTVHQAKGLEVNINTNYNRITPNNTVYLYCNSVESSVSNLSQRRPIPTVWRTKNYQQYL